MGNLKNVNLDVAKFALGCVENVINKKSNVECDKKYKIDKNNEINSNKYKTLVKKMPTLIQKNGFMNTLVFNLSKTKNKEHSEVLKNIIEWTNENCKISNIKEFREKNINFENVYENISEDMFMKYIKWITSLTQSEYRLITKEMINLFSWIKRFADGMIEEKEDEISEGEE